MSIKIPNKPIIIKNCDFQTIIVRVLFPYQEIEEELAKSTLLPNLLIYMNNKYKTEEEFQKEKKKNYILSTSCGRLTIGTTAFLGFSMIVPDSNSLGFDHLDNQFKFFHEILYNPKVINDSFDKFEFERELSNLKLSIESAMKNLKAYHTIKSLEAVDDEGILSRSVENHKEQLDEIDASNLYQFYLNLINKYKPLIFIFGNVDDNRINNLCDKYLYKNKDCLLSFSKNYNYFLKPRKDIKLVEETGNFKDSAISLLYKVKDMNEDDFNYLSLVKSLLVSLSSRMLNKKLRDDYNFIYSSKVNAYLRFGVLEITAYIHKDNKDIVIEKIKEVIEDIRNPENIKEALDNIKERKRINLIRSLDDKFSLLNDVTMKYLDTENTLEEDYEQIRKISAEDISYFIDRLVLDTICFVKEEENE